MVREKREKEVKETVGERADLVWKEEGQGGSKDSPQVDTIAKSHQVQVSRCLRVPRKETEGRRIGERERDARLPRNYSARRTRGSSRVILALGCRVIYPALLPFLPRLFGSRANEIE